MASSQFPLIDGKPAWLVRVENPGSFQVADHSNDFRLFHLPGAALLSWVLKLTDSTNESLIVHHVFDPSDAESKKYLDAVGKTGRLLLVFEGEGGFRTEISVGSAKLSRLLSQGVQYNARLSALNGAEALRAFLEIFNPVFRESGAEAAWSAVEKQVGFVSTSKPAIAPSSSGSSSSAESGADSQTARISARPGKPARKEDSESETGIRGVDFEPLLAAARPDLYRHNAFRIAELPVNAQNRDMDRRQRMIDMAAQTGAAVPAGPYRALPLQETVDAEHLREAMTRLRDPVQRIIDEIFWFWPLDEAAGEKDPAIPLLAENQVRPAFESWKKLGLKGDSTGLATHNLAVLCHAIALELEDPQAAKALKDVKPQEAAIFWDLAYKAWKMVLDSDPFWDRVEARIREINDPRLPTATVRRIRRTLPLALLTINGRLAAQAAEKGNDADSERHRKAMAQSGFEPALVDRSLRGALDPLRDRIAVLCSTAEREYQEDGEKGAEVAERLFQQAQPLLAGIDSIFPAGNPTRQAAHDDVALRARLAIIQYGNSKEIDALVLKLLKRALEVAEGENARPVLENDIATAQRLIKEAKENEVYTKCWFCKKSAPDLALSSAVTMYGNVTRESTYGGTRVKWQQNTLKIPRCKRCKAVHDKTDSWAAWFAGIAVVATIITALVLFFGSPGRKGGGEYAGLGCGGLVACVIVGLIFAGIGRMVGLAASPGDVKRESIKTSFPSILEAQRLGWAIGDKPPGVQ